MKVLKRKYVGPVIEGIKHEGGNLGEYQKEKDFPRTWYFSPYLIPAELGILKSNDIRFLCINPLRPVINSSLLTDTLTRMSRLKEACLGSGCHQEALRNWD